MFTLRRARARTALALALAASVVVAGGLTATLSASAAPIPATGGTLSWGVDAGYRGIFTTRGAEAPATLVGDIPTYPLASGSYDETTRQGSLSFQGAVRLGYILGPVPGVADGNYFFLKNPQVAIDGQTATISGTTAGSSHNTNSALTTTAQGVRSVATVDLSKVTPTVTDSNITWTAAPTAITAEGAAVLAHYDTAADAAPTKRATGSALDPVTISIARTAAVTPPDPEPTDPGTATPVATTTVVSVGAASPVTLGTSTTVTATVSADGETKPTGSVSFYDTPATTGTKKLLGTVPVTNGSASYTTALSAGGHQLSASFTGGTGFTDSSATLSTTANGVTTPTNVGVVDAAQAPVCTPTGSKPTTVEGVSATWDWSAYSAGWSKTASGDVAVDGQDFRLSKGVATASADCTRIAFTGSLTTAAYASFFPPDGQWITLVDPSLSIAKNGTGTWSAGVRTGTGTLTSTGPAPRVVVATLTGASVPDLTAKGSALVALDYEGKTAVGTWSAGYSDAWSNAFVLQVPAAIRSFYYKSGTTAANATKPPSPIALAWNGAVLPTDPGTGPTGPTDPTDPTDPTTPGTGAGNLAWGFKESWRSYVSGIAAGTTTTSGGATVGKDGRFVFPQGKGSTYSKATGVGTIDYTGSVLFTSKAHAFAIGLSNPQVTFTADGKSALTAAVSTSDTAGLGSTTRITVATLEATKALPLTTARITAQATVDESSVWTGVSTTFVDDLRPDGWAQYSGQAADPVSFGYNTAAVTPGTGTGSGPGTGTDPGTGSGAGHGEDPAIVPAGATDKQPTCEANAVSGASLTWGVKESFRSYVTGSIAKGSIALNGATENSNGAYVFSGGAGSVNTVDTLGRVAWSGGVTFAGHDGALKIVLSNPSVRLSGPTTATLYADVASKALKGSDVALTQAAIATVDLKAATSSSTASAIAYSGAPATLTAAGATAFAGFYSAGQALDPVSFSLPVGAGVACDKTTDAKLAFTGSNGTGELLAGAGLMLLAGLAISILRRRRAAL